jgi:hypothetical protein
LRKLEDSNTCERWLTLSDDDDKWEQYAKENGFSEKSPAGKILFFFKKKSFYVLFLESSLTLTLPTKNFLSIHSASKRL